MRDALNRDQVIAAAASLLQRDGFRRFSMRRLAADLGVAPTAIYWHVGNREEVLDALLDQARGVLGRVSTVGDSPAERIVSTATALLADVNRHRGLVELAHQRGLLTALIGPIRRAIATEFAAAGLRGPEVADATNAVTQLISEHATFEHYAQTWPEQDVSDTGLPDGIDPALNEAASAALVGRPERERTFAIMLRALVVGLLTDHATLSAGEGPIRTADTADTSVSKP